MKHITWLFSVLILSGCHSVSETSTEQNNLASSSPIITPTVPITPIPPKKTPDSTFPRPHFPTIPTPPTRIPTKQGYPQTADSFTMKVGESTSIDENLSFKFDSVSEDSRCPQGRTCIWAGNAVVVLKFSDNSKASLNTYSEPHEIIKGAYKITLLSLSSYPGGTSPLSQNSYVAQFMVNKL